MTKKEYAVRTLFVANFFDPGAEMAKARRNQADMQTLVNAMKRVELADQTLERELNGFAGKGYDMAAVIQHAIEEDGHDLLITAIFSRDAE